MSASDSFDATLRSAVRAEATTLDAAFTEALAAGESAGIPAQEVIGRALSRIRQRDAGRTGRLGERVARVRAKKRRIPSASGSARFRIPDILTDEELIEIKNVSRLSLTPQLADFLALSELHGLRFVLVTRFDTELAPELQSLVDSGRIERRLLPGLLSENGRRLLRGLIANSLNE